METNSEDVLWTSIMTETKWSQPIHLSSAGHDDLLQLVLYCVQAGRAGETGYEACLRRPQAKPKTR